MIVFQFMDGTWGIDRHPGSFPYPFQGEANKLFHAVYESEYLARDATKAIRELFKSNPEQFAPS